MKQFVWRFSLIICRFKKRIDFDETKMKHVRFHERI